MKIKSYILPTIIALSALSVSASAAFYSITGLSKLFAGAATAVIIMASSLEVSKLVIASLLYQYWKKLAFLLKTYLTIALSVLILITSAGIYGFLSSAYQEIANKSAVYEQQIVALENKKQTYIDIKEGYMTDKTFISNSTSELRSAISKNTVLQSVDKKGNVITRESKNNRKTFEKQLDKALVAESKLNDKLDIVNDSIFSVENQILTLKANNQLSGELGPLKYLSNLTGYPMDSIINWLLLVIIFVFDPLAISLVIAANFAFKQINTVKIQPTIVEHQEDIPEPEPIVEPHPTEPSHPLQPLLSRTDISGWRKKKIMREMGEDDTTKTY